MTEQRMKMSTLDTGYGIWDNILCIPGQSDPFCIEQRVPGTFIL